MPTSKATPSTRLPFAILYTALGVILAKRDHGAVKALTSEEMSRAIAIATAQRQRAGHVLAGSRTLSAAGVAWQRAKKRERGPEAVAADEAEWERLVELTRVKPSVVYDLRLRWSAKARAWEYLLTTAGGALAAGELPKAVRGGATVEAIMRAAATATARVKLDAAGAIRYDIGPAPKK